MFPREREWAEPDQGTYDFNSIMGYESTFSADKDCNTNQVLWTTQRLPQYAGPGNNLQIHQGGSAALERKSISLLDALRVSQIYPGTAEQQALAAQWQSQGRYDDVETKIESVTVNVQMAD
jgi:hypothetical protein